MIKILLADDEPIMRKALTTLIDWASLSCEIVGAVGDGLAALEAVKQTTPQILIADIKMPGMDGIEVAKYIYLNKLPVKVILLTAYADFSYAQQAIRYGVSEYVTKDGAMEKIVAAVQQCKAQLVQQTQKADFTEAEAVLGLKSVLDGSLYGEEKITEKMHSIGISLTSYAVLCVEILREKSLSSAPLPEMAPFFSTVFSKADITYIPMGKDVYCAVLQSPGEDIYGNCKKLSQTFSAFCGCGLCIGISAYTHGAACLRPAWEQAKNALDERFFREDERVFLWQENTLPAKAKATQSNCWSRLAAAILRGDDEDAAAQLSALFALQQKEPPAEVREAGMQLLDLCQSQLQRVGADSEELSCEASSRRAIETCRFFSEYCTLLRELTAQSCRIISSNLQYSGDLAQSAQNYIETHYMHAITLPEIAAAVGANASYLSRIFKLRTGSSVVDTITRLRMEQAQMLLRSSNLRIAEIAQSVGIEDTNYFGQLFRKYTGQTPKQYRITNEGGTPHAVE